jgi:GAF domain-containing protein
VALEMIALAGRAHRGSAGDAAQRAVQRLTREAIPTLADFCLVYQLAGRVLRAIAAVHVTRQGSRDVRALMKAYRIGMADRVSTVAQVVRTQRPIVRTEIRSDPGKAKAGSVANLHRRLATRSALVVPIVHDGAVLGAVSLCFSPSGRAYDGRSIATAERFARRIAKVLMPVEEGDAPRPLERAAREGRTVRQRATTQR